MIKLSIDLILTWTPIWYCIAIYILLLTLSEILTVIYMFIRIVTLHVFEFDLEHACDSDLDAKSGLDFEVSFDNKLIWINQHFDICLDLYSNVDLDCDICLALWFL